MPKTKIKSIILFIAMVLVVSGCGRELGIKNEELGIKGSGEMGGLVEQVATTSNEINFDDIFYDKSIIKLTGSDSENNFFESEKYNFEFKLSKDWIPSFLNEVNDVAIVFTDDSTREASFGIVVEENICSYGDFLYQGYCCEDFLERCAREKKEIGYSEKKIGDYKVATYIDADGIDSIAIFYIVFSDKYIYSFSSNEYVDNKNEEIEKIIETFKILN